MISNIKRIGKNSEKSNQLINYYSKNENRMKYQDYVKIGCGIIGSGAIERTQNSGAKKDETIGTKMELQGGSKYA